MKPLIPTAMGETVSLLFFRAWGRSTRVSLSVYLFRVHFRDRFAHSPDLPVQEVCSDLADSLLFERLKQLVARVLLLNAKSVMRWSRAASTNRQRYTRTSMISLSLCPAIWKLKSVEKSVVRYEQRAGANINLDKSEGLWLGTWGVAFPCQGLSTWVTDPSASLGCDSGLGSNGSEICRKYWRK